MERQPSPVRHYEEGAVVIPVRLCGRLYSQLAAPKRQFPDELRPILGELSKAAAAWSIRQTQTIELDRLRARVVALEKMAPRLDTEASTAEASQLLRLSTARVRQLASADRLPGSRKIGREWWIPRAAIAAYRDGRNGEVRAALQADDTSAGNQ